MDKLLEIQAPLDGRRVGQETWLELYRHWKARGGLGIALRDIFNRQNLSQALDRFFYELRQPDWWQGDDKPHPPTYEGAMSKLEARLKSGAFAVTAEVAPPLAATGASIEKKIHMLADHIDAANFTDNPSATPRMSSLASALIGQGSGVESVLQMTARDRTRLAVQSDALGASALGIRNILCLSGDHPRLGPSPMARLEPMDVDSIQMLWILRRMRDEGKFLDGRTIKTPPRYFLGAAASPYASNPRFQALREEKKVNAGAQFFQTQLIYDFDPFEQWLEELDKQNLLGRVYILAGVGPLRSARAAHFMNDEVPGVVVPQPIIDRMERAADPEEEGIQVALEIIDRLKCTPGIAGIHIMAVGWESVVPRLVEESGIGRSRKEPEFDVEQLLESAGVVMSG
jgi:methylenetetrahydrofolate reductase (NADPH)